MSNVIQMANKVKTGSYVLHETLNVPIPGYFTMCVNGQLDVLMSRVWECQDLEVCDCTKILSQTSLLKYVLSGYLNPFNILTRPRLLYNDHGDFKDFSIEIEFSRFPTIEEIDNQTPTEKLLDLTIKVDRGDEARSPVGVDARLLKDQFCDPKGEFYLPAISFITRLEDIANINNGGTEYILYEHQKEDGIVYRRSFICGIPNEANSIIRLELTGPEL